jgi:hypothetical protein
MERYVAAGKTPMVQVGVVNQQMPFMPNGAEVALTSSTSWSRTRPATHTLFAPPNNKVSTADYAIGLHASSLVADGGTLQIGIGSLGDAIAQALIVRDRHGPSTAHPGQPVPRRPGRRELAASTRGSTAARRCSSTASCKLIEAGIIRREVFGDARRCRQLLNDGRIADENVTPQMLRALMEPGASARHCRHRTWPSSPTTRSSKTV